ncbi:MAG: flagellar hook protein FlgE [Fimbriimonadales bacterium]|nr:MAG: flagellar hook protein FlgE [Fimbriimonadales bacterium]
MWQAMLSGVASLKAHQTKMNVIGNNIANINTTGYKGSRVHFQDLMAQTFRAASRPSNVLGGVNPIQVGLGVKVGAIDVQTLQGALEMTGRTTDLAIQGNGYFMLTNGRDIHYTRDGAFGLDSSGFLVHRGTGWKVLGWMADAGGLIDTNQAINAASVLQFPVGSQAAVRQTSTVQYTGNLNANAPATQTYAATVRVYDALGGAHDVTITFTNRQTPPLGTPPTGAVSSWEWSAAIGSTPVGDFTTGSNTRLYFDGQGQLIGATSQQITITPTNGAPPFTVNLDLSQVTSLAAESIVQPVYQDGFPPGTLQEFTIGIDGTIQGVFSNGLSRPMGRIALSLFANSAGLFRLGNNMWRVTDNSGLPQVGAPTTGGLGEINAGYLEQSNVDLGSEFADMIVTQRGFQANTRIVSVVDELLADVVNMKR